MIINNLISIMDFIVIIHDNNIYKIKKEPFETDENTYIRGWFIINSDINDDTLISRSIIYLNESKNNMKYI
jgi:hypothetical protein